MNKQNFWWHKEQWLSDGILLNIIIGGRGCGKTYAMKELKRNVNKFSKKKVKNK